MDVKGRWFVRLYGPDGALKDYREGDNVVVTAGKNFLASFLNSAATGASTFTMRYVAIGSDSTGEADTQTALGTELSRQSGIVSYVSNVFAVIATFGAGSGTGAIYEYGLFSVATASCGTMFSRDAEALITKAAGDTLTVETRITFS
jgi:hypothetical protein